MEREAAVRPLGEVVAFLQENLERRPYNNRFDDLRGRFGTLYCALIPETALPELLADLRPDAAAIARYIKIQGPDAA